MSDRVYTQLLRAIQDGRIAPGERLNDVELALSLGVSRTPVRDAIQRLRAVGVVESEPNRFTRVRAVTAGDVREYLVVWLALAHPLFEEAISAMAPQSVKRLERLARSFGDSVAKQNSTAAADAVYDFFAEIEQFGSNQALKQAIGSAQAVLRIGGVLLPEWVDTDAIRTALDAIAMAAQMKKPQLAQSALRELHAIHIPPAASAGGSHA